MKTPHIRQAVFSDLEELAELFNQYREFQGQTGDLPAARDFLKARFDHGESVVFIAHVDAAPVGFAQLYPVSYTHLDVYKRQTTPCAC